MERLEVVSLRAEEREFVLLVAAVVVCELPFESDRSDGWRRLIIFEKPSNRVSGTEMIAEPTAFNGFISEETYRRAIPFDWMKHLGEWLKVG